MQTNISQLFLETELGREAEEILATASIVVSVRLHVRHTSSLAMNLMDRVGEST